MTGGKQRQGEEKQNNGNDKKISEEQPVRFIHLEGEEKDEKPPTDVYASRMPSNQDKDTSNGNGNDNDFIDVKISTDPLPSPFAEPTDYDVVIVGAGCSGIGTSLMLTKIFNLPISRVLCLEQGTQVGTSFREWPEEMRFISPSFNQQGWTDSFDLNSIYWGTSPANLLRDEHPTGEDYALYLEAMADQSGVQVQLETKVLSISDMSNGDGDDDDAVKRNIVNNENVKDGSDAAVPGPFNVEIETKNTVNGGTNQKTRKTISSRFIVWAGGEFQHPRDKRTISYVYKQGEENSGKPPTIKIGDMFPGADYCLHNSRVKSWAKLHGDDLVVIGGYESGVDAAYHLAKAGKKCKVLASSPTWCIQTGDPSSELAPYTAGRLREVLSPGFTPQPKMLAPLRVIAVDKAEGGGYNIAAKWKKTDEQSQNTAGLGFQIDEPGEEDSIMTLHTEQPPILCTGFEGSVKAQARNLFDFPDPNNKKGCIGDGPLLTRNDESTKVPGVFLVGPSVTHGELSFCFVYKFRQRFAVVANAICEGMGMDTREAVAQCRQVNMYLDNFATCEDTCGDTC
eukprot:CAMPEP_0194080948 /NCGR_PEP_ID=MMETSP0149-20130528/6857_1 /TAXON_ID=122233 /ORGANISM="Chaetoceros debilis, Strain MM31A-1" /LENGTH=565 /DNA_ID=CAMNT_0038762777 /DNA_START=387 /DNA_END=2084 /DNA_ORIENTATION=-